MPLTNKRAVFFDAGYTLLEPTSPVAEVYWNAAVGLCVELDRDAFISHMTREWKEVLRTYRSSHPELHSSDELEKHAWEVFTLRVAEPFPELKARHSEWLEALFEHFDQPGSWKLRPAVTQILDWLANQQVTLGVVSNWHSVLHKIIQGHGLADRFEFVLTSAEVGRKKPHPLIFEEALRRAGASARDTVHIGDSWDDDVVGALGVGINAVFLGSTPPQPAADGVHVVACLSELLESAA